MTSTSIRRSANVLSALAACALLLGGCPPTPVCSRGQLVTIPQADTTPPGVRVDIRGRAGALVQVTAGSPGPFQIHMPKGAVTIDATAQDPEGIRKLSVAPQLRTCTTARATGQRTCTTAPPQIFTSEDTNTAGASGCTERFLSTPANVNRTLTTTRDEVEESANVLVTSLNFGGRSAATGWKEILPLP